MMTSSNVNIFRVTCHLCGEFTGDRWIPRTKANGVLMFSLICDWINGWGSNGQAGDLWRHCAHYDVIVMISVTQFSKFWNWQVFISLHPVDESSLLQVMAWSRASDKSFLEPTRNNISTKIMDSSLLQWRHMSVKSYHFALHSIVCSRAYSN